MYADDDDHDDGLDLDEWDSFHAQAQQSAIFNAPQQTIKSTTEKESEFSDEEDDDENLEEQQQEETIEDSMFSVEEIHFEWDRTIKEVIAVQENLLVVTENNTVIYNEEDNTVYREFVINAKADEKIHKAFIDPTGSHVIISMTNGDNYYTNTQANKNPKLMPKLKNIIIESIGWNKQEGTPKSTGPILLGTSSSAFYEAKLESDKDPLKYIKKLFDLSEKLDVLVSTGPIVGLEVEAFPTSKSNPVKTYLVLAITQFRLFQFIGGPNFQEMFDEYEKGKILTYKELPYTTKRSSLGKSELHLFRKSPNAQPESFAWLSNAGIFHGTLTFTKRKPGDSAIVESEIIQYDSKSPSISSMTITEHHMVILLPDRLQIIMQPPALCNSVQNKEEFAQIPLSSVKVVFQELFPQLLGVTRDQKSGDIYIYTESACYKIICDDEERDVWRLYLEKALNPMTSKETHFDMALRLCKDDPKKRDLVNCAKADYYFKNGRYEEAADIYAKTTKSFEQVAISFYNKGERDALRKFLCNKLELTVSKKQQENEDATQLSCLCTWLTEIYLDKINELSDKGPTAEKECAAMQKEFRKFLEKHKAHLNKETTFRLISSHGQIAELLNFAMLIEDYERVISHYITCLEYHKAVEVLSKHCNTKQYAEHFYKFAPILMQHVPKETVDVLMQKKFLDPGRLVPALMRYIATYDPKKEQENQVIKYLDWCVTKQQNDDPAIHNLLLSLYAKEDDSTRLLAFLNVDNENNYYDPKYALRVCSENGKSEACIRLYSSMGLYEDAIELALKEKDIALAKDVADKPEDPEVKKRLWLRIAKHVIEVDNDVKKAIEFLRYTSEIKLEDILPFFPDFVLIDDFKDEICKSLEEYKQEIEELKQNMVDATQNATLIRDDIKDLKHKYGYVAINAKCDANCFQSILAQEFYVFPCQHMFHTECLVNEVKKHSSSSKNAKIDELMRKRKEFVQEKDDSQEKQKQDNLRELEQLISSECPLCGTVMINSIDAQFVDSNDPDVSTWNIEKPVDDLDD